MTGPLTAGAISYLFIMVRDLDAMAAFYRDLLGFRLVFMQEGASAFLKLDGGSTQIALLAGREAPSGAGAVPANHWFLVIDVAGLDAAAGALRERGVEVGPVFDVPFGRAATFSDPEGNIIEVHEMNVPSS